MIVSSHWLKRLARIADRCAYNPDRISAADLKMAIVCIHEIIDKLAQPDVGVIDTPVMTEKPMEADG